MTDQSDARSMAVVPGDQAAPVFVDFNALPARLRDSLGLFLMTDGFTAYDAEEDLGPKNRLGRASDTGEAAVHAAADRPEWLDRLTVGMREKIRAATTEVVISEAALNVTVDAAVALAASHLQGKDDRIAKLAARIEEMEQEIVGLRKAPSKAGATIDTRGTVAEFVDTPDLDEGDPDMEPAWKILGKPNRGPQAPAGGVEAYAAKEFDRVAAQVAADLRERANQIEREAAEIATLGERSGASPKLFGYSAIAAAIVKIATNNDITLAQMVRAAGEADAYRAARIHGAED